MHGLHENTRLVNMLMLFTGVFFALFAAFAALDFAYSPRRYPSMRWWRARGVASLVLYFALTTFAPALWVGLLGAHTLFDVTGWPLVAQLAAGLVIAQLVGYLWHRMLHVVPPTWRLHQTHHAAERLDIWSAYHFHPLDTVGFAFAGTLAIVWILGVSAPTAIAIGLAGAFLDMFTHANIKTPHWLGYIVTRPEMHAVHHERGVHKWNYSTLPLIDMAFGTYRNPRTFEAEVGFYDGASEKFASLLLGRNVADGDAAARALESTARDSTALAAEVRDRAAVPRIAAE